MILDIGDLIILKTKTPLMVVSRFEVNRFEFKEDNSNKFWEIFVTGNDYVTRWGRVGTEGQSQVKTFTSNQDAIKQSNNATKEKLNKGYKKVSKDNSYIYVFSDPTNPGSKKWLSYQDLDAYLNREKAVVQKKNKV